MAVNGTWIAAAVGSAASIASSQDTARKARNATMDQANAAKAAETAAAQTANARLAARRRALRSSALTTGAGEGMAMAGKATLGG